jgi:hypothetical protein
LTGETGSRAHQMKPSTVVALEQRSTTGGRPERWWRAPVDWVGRSRTPRGPL